MNIVRALSKYHYPRHSRIQLHCVSKKSMWLRLRR